MTRYHFFRKFGIFINKIFEIFQITGYVEVCQKSIARFHPVNTKKQKNEGQSFNNQIPPPPLESKMGIWNREMKRVTFFLEYSSYHNCMQNTEDSFPSTCARIYAMYKEVAAKKINFLNKSAGAVS